MFVAFALFYAMLVIIHVSVIN